MIDCVCVCVCVCVCDTDTYIETGSGVLLHASAAIILFI